MSYTVKNQLTITVDSDRYHCEFDGEEIYIHDKENSQRIAFSGSMSESTEIASLILELHRQSTITKIVKEEVV